MLPISIIGSIVSTPSQNGQAIAVLDLVQVGEGRLEVAAGLDAGEMPARAVGARHPGALAQRLVGDDAADRALA